MKKLLILFVIVPALLTGCSSTEMVGSWSSQEYKGQVQKVYIIGLAKKDLNKRIFEDTFSRQLESQGVQTIASYKDFPQNQEVSKEAIAQRMLSTGCDSVLLTQLVAQRKETVTSPGYTSGYSSGFYGGRSHSSWGNYYNNRYDVVYHPPMTTEFVILTVESVLYDLKTEEMIWSAQLETILESNIEKMIQDFVETVTEDLKNKNLI